jgi:hypothetical protein
MSNNIGGLLTQGGVPATGPQTALNQYQEGEGGIKASADFSGGMGHSTNATQAQTGPIAQFAESQGKDTIANTAAQAAFLNSSFKNFAGGLGSLIPSLGKAGGG